MDLLDGLKTRRSKRKYLSKPVPKELVEEILEAARFTPSANNLQPWEFVVVTEKERRERVASLTD